MSGTVGISCCQLAPQIGQLEANLRATADAIADAAAGGANIVVLPELAVSGYAFSGPDEARSLAEPLDGPTVTAWSALAREHRLVIVGGVCERRESDGVLHNTAVIVDQEGLRAAYRKAHLWDREADSFAAGVAPRPAVDTEHGRIGVVVCYDLEFPEWIRLPALDGVELLCAPVNWPSWPTPDGERPTEVVRVQAAASVNRVFIAACDRAGRERGVDWVGGTVIVGPDGFPVAGPAGAGEVRTLSARCDLAQARDKRLGDRNDVLADRRPELYGRVSGG